MILKQLFNGRQFSSFVLVQENECHASCHVVRKFISENLSKRNSVHVFSNFTSGCSSSPYKEYMMDNLFHMHECFYNPWQLPVGGANTSNNFNIDTAFTSFSESNGIILIIIDSISYALLTTDLEFICSQIVNVKGKNSDTLRVQILGIVNTDLTKENSREYIEIKRLAQSFIILGKEKSSSGTNCIQVVHRKSLGKSIKKDYTISLSNEGALEYLEKSNDPTILGNGAEVEPTVPIVSTFRLTLDDKEKSSRAQVILPYLMKRSGTASGKILYEPDANDDWDDEDPDDDLDI